MSTTTLPTATQTRVRQSYWQGIMHLSKQGIIANKSCGHCGGNLSVDVDKYGIRIYCIQCGRDNGIC